ncbi:MAG TPA: hypothetical protein VFH17_06555, partial [Coriobacteriia bacterium]|nr:hypothetical protein [Coriobacteriia bacterium]
MMSPRSRWFTAIVVAMLVLSTVTAMAAVINPVLCDEGNPPLIPGGIRIDPPPAVIGAWVTYTKADLAAGDVAEPVPDDFWIKIKMNPDKGFDWESNYYMEGVVVKGGPVANCYNYYEYPGAPWAPISSDTNLYAPIGPSGYYGVSHIDFYFGGPVVYEELVVTKTAETSYVRTHNWLIDKWVETEKGDTIGEENTPKIWLLEGYAESECATWYVDVDYDGYVDSDFAICGTVTVENIGTADAVITGVEDLLGDDEIPVTVDFGVSFPYTLEAGDTLEGTYCEDVDSKIEGKNWVTVTTEESSYQGFANLTWAAPDEQVDDVVTIKDVSDLFFTQTLGMLNAADYEVGEGELFEYGTCFDWADYSTPGPHLYNNTATIVETGQSDSAVLDVNWRHEDLAVDKTAETSYARTHNWLIDKWVETEKGDTIGEENTPKIWLLEGYAESECPTWYVDV